MRTLLLPLAALSLTASPLAAQTASAEAPTSAAVTSGEFARFIPREDNRKRLDWQLWTDALQYMVLNMGQSLREAEGKPLAQTGTRQVYGHDSRIRLEGNRVMFSLMADEAIEPIAEYRRDLERIGGEIDIATLPRKEQLAYWMNLHNVATIEMIAANYPAKSPSRIKIGDDKVPMDRAKFITVGGVAMSPHDIRTRIVFPNWSDPKVIYGFFRGELGGPSIRKEAFTADTVDMLLIDAAGEFVNSLRGVEKYGKNLLVSKIYEEAAPFFFTDFEADLRAHLRTHAQEEVAGLIDRAEGVKYNAYVDTTADLAGGERQPIYYGSTTLSSADSLRVPPSVARLLGERYEKYEKLRREGLLRGRVIVLPPTTSERAQELEDAAEPETEPQGI
ncbi:DUF547 domain-containing protein [Qipengyuania aurantiaca]|uniref:DUF547 domain-containing protein n=1 Tax=Qipengyuania aurantiaca TaxID=2867233 RepID=UPI001FFC408F|nr:DUF547 domain-containing protein [Qipengyuania aurantiaca]